MDYVSLRNKFFKGGFTFIEVIVGTALILIIFVGFVGAYRLGFKIVGKSKARTTATALANEKLEFARNLAYKDVGTIGGIPSGSLPETEILVRNGIQYTVKTTVVYIDDPFDGLAPQDPVPNDYKRVKVKVSWGGLFGGEVMTMSDIAPRGLESNEGTGNILVSVFNAFGIGIPQANIHIVNNEVSPPIDANFQTNDKGTFLIVGAPTSTQSYQVTITKPSYSTSRTYGTEEVANPNQPHLTVLEGQLTEVSFSIDLVSSFSVDTLSPQGADSFADSFADQSKITELSDVVIENGKVHLATTTATSTQYVPSGYLVSSSIAPTNLYLWDKFSWNDEEPVNTDILYKVLYFSGSEWVPVPDSDLLGNSSGFDDSPIDLSGLSTTTYSQLKLRADLSTQDSSTTPELFDWQLTWKTNEPTPIGNASFHLKGSKTIGTDAEDLPVYKYSQDHTSNSGGHVDISNLEWDEYTFSVDPSTGLDLIETVPSPQPISLDPDTNEQVKLFLSSENSLIMQLRDSETTDPIFSGTVRVFNTLSGYDKTLFTDSEGKALFIPIDQNSYNYEISAAGYQSANGTISVSGDTIKVINLIPQN